MGLGRGWACIGIQSLRLGPGYKDRPSEAAWSGVGPSRPRRAEWGWGGVGLATRIGQVGPRGGGWGGVWPYSAE